MGSMRSLRSQHLQPLTGERLLSAWDQGLQQHNLERALTLLRLALPETRRDELAALSMADRDLLLLRLRSQTFGPSLEGTATCAHCAGTLEFAMPLQAAIEDLEDRSHDDCVEWQEEGRLIKMRPANTLDLLATLNETQPCAAEDLLLARCTTVDGSPEEHRELACLSNVREHFEQLNQAAERRCTLTCPECSRTETLDLDVAGFLWMEVRHAAQQLLADIHILASHYGWSERDITGMSAHRRQTYLEWLPT
jgi:hypothetical protein